MMLGRLLIPALPSDLIRPRLVMASGLGGPVAAIRAAPRA